MMNEQGKMMNPQQQQQRMSLSQSQMMSGMSQPQIFNPQQQQQPQMMMNRSYRMWPQMQPPLPVDQLTFQTPNPNVKQFVTGKRSKPLGPRNNWNGKKVNKNKKRMDAAARRHEIGTSGGGTVAGTAAGGNVGGVGGYKPPTLNDLQRQNRVKARRFFPKKKFYNYNNNNNNNMNAPYAPRNTSSYIIRAKKSGGIASLVSPCPVTPAVLPTPIFSPSREVLVDMAKEEWGVDGYGSMNGLIRLRSPGEHEDEEEEEGGGSSESDVEEHVEVERRLDHDLSRFEMIYPNYTGMDYSNVLGNRVDDQDSHIAQLEEENLILKDRLFLMERELSDLRRRLQSLERQGGHGCEEMNEEVVENESENDSESHGDGGHSLEDNSGGHSLEDNNVELVEGHMEGARKEENRMEDDAESAGNEEKVDKEGEMGNDGNGNDEAVDEMGNDGNRNDEAVEEEFSKDGKEDEGDEIDEASRKEVTTGDRSKGVTNTDIDVKTGSEVQASDNAGVGDVTMEEASRVDAGVVSQTKKEDELPGNE